MPDFDFDAFNHDEVNEDGNYENGAPQKNGYQQENKVQHDEVNQPAEAQNDAVVIDTTTNEPEVTPPPAVAAQDVAPVENTSTNHSDEEVDKW